MKSILFKSVFILLLAIGFSQTADAHGFRHYYRHYCGPRYIAPRAYYYAPAPRVYYTPAPQAYYAPRYIPGHWRINRWGERIWVRPYSR